MTNNINSCNRENNSYIQRTCSCLFSNTTFTVIAVGGGTIAALSGLILLGVFIPEVGGVLFTPIGGGVSIGIGVLIFIVSMTLIVIKNIVKKMQQNEEPAPDNRRSRDLTDITRQAQQTSSVSTSLSSEEEETERASQRPSQDPETFLESLKNPKLKHVTPSRRSPPVDPFLKSLQHPNLKKASARQLNELPKKILTEEEAIFDSFKNCAALRRAAIECSSSESSSDSDWE